MNEELLQFAWKYQFFEKVNLHTQNGEDIEIIDPGKWNDDSGPDFFNSNIKIGDTLWAGNVEIHINASDWMKHGHNIDRAYDNVILHVVYNPDTEIILHNSRKVPTFVIKIDTKVEERYKQLMHTAEKPACQNVIQLIDSIYVQSTIDAMLIDRIADKTKAIEYTLLASKSDWNQTFFQHLGRNFGFKLNALPFEMLTRTLPLRILNHHADNLYQIEALLFGQSGMLNEQLLGDDYFLKLREEYSYLAQKYKLKGIEAHLWKYMRLRPANFPSIRIAQFAQLHWRNNNLFSKIIEIETVQELLKLFELKASEYWNEHYRFNMKSTKRVKKLGESSQINLLINTVVPFLYLYGERNNKPSLKYRAIEILESLPSEKNRIISLWSEIGIKSSNAYSSQALIQLKNVYCDNKKCLKCKIGNKILSL